MQHSALPPAEALTLVTLADIARGGMGMVQLCRATDGRLRGRALAVKRLNPALEEEPEFVNMFLDETWITATIASPHVVKVEAWGRDDEGLFLAVELVEGVSLSRLVKESKEKQEPFAERTVAFLASQVCAGLVAAHELKGENGATLGLVHRDLTPGNILISFDGLVKIADFGIAKAEERLTNTRIGMMKGKPAYMAPEQARGGGIDARADLFALGVVIFELLSGRRPWLGTNDLETLVNVTTKDPPKLGELRKTSPVFVEIVEKCLKKNPTHRFSSAGEVKEKLDAWRRERGFEADDQASFAAFVRRNTAQQQTWFREALTGHGRGGMTFADLEARIDRVRKKEAAAAGAPVSGGVGAPSGPMVPASAPQSSTPRAPPRGAPTVPMSAAALAANGGRVDEVDDDAKTMFMPPGAMSPSSGPFQPATRTPSGSLAHLASTVALTPEEAAAVSSRLSRSSPSGPLPGAPSAPMAATILDDGSGLAAHLAPPPPTEDAPAVWQPVRRRRSKLLIALVVLLVLAALGAIYYFVVRPRLPPGLHLGH